MTYLFTKLAASPFRLPKLDSAFRLAEPGVYNGTFGLSSLGLDGTLSVGSDGVVHWTPDGDDDAGTYTVAATYNYATGSQMKALSLTIQAPDLPPEFPYTGYGGGGATVGVGAEAVSFIDYPCNYPCWAGDAEDQTLTYTFLPAGTDPPADCAIDSSGYFCCTFYPADADKVFDFYIQATDSNGGFDLKKMVIPVYDSLSKTTYLTAKRTGYCTVMENTGGDNPGDYLGFVGGDSFIFPDPIPSGQYPATRVAIDTYPTHGQLTVDSQGLYYVPAVGFRGLDTFTCHLEVYDTTNPSVVYPSEHNVAPEYIQVGSCVNLTPASKYGETVATDLGQPWWQQSSIHPVVDEAVLGVGETTTATLTLENPWGSGYLDGETWVRCPAAGYWCLDFDASKIRVYEGDQELVPGDPLMLYNGTKVLEQNIVGDRTITLTVVGVGAGAAPVNAEWRVWDNNTPTSYPPSFSFEWTTRAEYAVVAVDLEIDSGNTGLYVGPNYSAQEEYLEDNSYALGKVIFPNWGDSDDDQVLNCWDGYKFDTSYTAEYGANKSHVFYPMTFTLPAGLDPAIATVSFDYNMAATFPVPADRSALDWDTGPGTIRIWTKDGNQAQDGTYVTDNPQACGDLVPAGYTLKASDFGYSGLGLTFTLYVEGVSEANYIHDYDSVQQHARPTQEITLKFYPTGNTGGPVFTDTVQYIVADWGWPASSSSPAVPASFYWDLQTHEELRAALASDGVYTNADLKQYCMQKLDYEDTCAVVTGVVGFDPTIESLFSMGGRVYHDYISGKNLLTFRGTEAGLIFTAAGLDDWIDNYEQAMNPPAPQYTAAMTIARRLGEIWTGPTGPVSTPTTPSNWLIAGHSLGGGLAAAASVASGFHADTFNAAGVNYLTVQPFDVTITSAAVLQGRAAGLVTSYVVNGEILNYAQDGLLAPELGLDWPLAGDLPVSIGTRVPLDSGYFIFGGWLDLYTRYYLHGYFVESLLLSYDFPLN